MKSSWSQWAQETSKNECFSLKFIEKLYFQNLIFQKEENKTSFNKNAADQARPNQFNKTEVRRSIWRRRPTTTSPSSTSSSSAPMATTSGTSTPPSQIRNITADSPPSWQFFWSRPLMANLGKSTTLLQVAMPYWGWVGDSIAEETFNPWVVGWHTSTSTEPNLLDPSQRRIEKGRPIDESKTATFAQGDEADSVKPITILLSICTMAGSDTTRVGDQVQQASGLHSMPHSRRRSKIARLVN